MPRRDFLDRHGETAQWAQRHKIATLLNNMVWHLTEAKPEDPLDDLLLFMTGVNAQLVAMEKREQQETAEKQKAKVESESNGGAADKPSGKDSGKDGTSGKSKAAQDRAKVIEKRIRREKALAATLKEGESSPARTERKKSKKQNVAPLTDVEKELTAEEDEGNNKDEERQERTDKTDSSGPAASGEQMEPAPAPSETEQKDTERGAKQPEPASTEAEETAAPEAEGEEKLDAERRRAAAEAVDDASASAIEVRQEARREESTEGATNSEEGPSDKSVLAIQARLRQRQAKADHEARLREAEEKL